MSGTSKPPNLELRVIVWMLGFARLHNLTINPCILIYLSHIIFILFVYICICITGPPETNYICMYLYSKFKDLSVLCFLFIHRKGRILIRTLDASYFIVMILKMFSILKFIIISGNTFKCTLRRYYSTESNIIIKSLICRILNIIHIYVFSKHIV